jgi:hypothetical protein
MTNHPTVKTARQQKLLASVLGLASFCFPSGGLALAQTPAPQKAAGGTLTIDPAERRSRGPVTWTG